MTRLKHKDLIGLTTEFQKLLKICVT